MIGHKSLVLIAFIELGYNISNVLSGLLLCYMMDKMTEI